MPTKENFIGGKIIMSKSELVDFIAQEAGLTKADAAKAVDAFQKGVIKGVKESGKVTLVGFGTYTSKRREGRNGINPLTQKPMSIPAKNVVSFKPGSKFKEEIN